MEGRDAAKGKGKRVVYGFEWTLKWGYDILQYTARLWNWLDSTRQGEIL